MSWNKKAMGDDFKLESECSSQQQPKSAAELGREAAAKQRWEMACAFTSETGEALVEDWMLWTHWFERVGCDECRRWRRQAVCFGRAGCHGISFGCGCGNCSPLRGEIRRAVV